MKGNLTISEKEHYPIFTSNKMMVERGKGLQRVQYKNNKINHSACGLQSNLNPDYPTENRGLVKD